MTDLIFLNNINISRSPIQIIPLYYVFIANLIPFEQQNKIQNLGNTATPFLRISPYSIVSLELHKIGVRLHYWVGCATHAGARRDKINR